MEELIDEWQWRQIRFCGNTEPETPSRAHYIYGEEYGIQWFIDHDTKRAEWVVTATDGKRTYTERFGWIHEPVFGIDVTDANRIEEVLDRLVSKCKSGNLGRLKEWFRRIFKNRQDYISNNW